MSKNNVLVSVVIPVYNISDYVEKCLSSVSKQIYTKLEIIVVDDGSTDTSGKICDQFAKKDARFKVFHTKNQGLSVARDFGIKKAKGEYLALIDGDDFIEPSFVSEMLKVALKDDLDIVVCGYNHILPEKKVLSGEEATLELLLRQNNLEIVAWNKLYRRSLFIVNQIFYPAGFKNEDTLTTYKLLAAAKKVTYLSVSYYHYVERDTSIMKSQDILERLKMRQKAAEEAIIYFKDNVKLRTAAEVALLTADLAYVDFGVVGKIDPEISKLARKRILNKHQALRQNQFLTLKLKIYLWLLAILGGKPYFLFRKIKRN